MMECGANVQLNPLEIDEGELLARYEKLYTAVVYDVLMMELGVFAVLPTDLLPLSDGMKVCGIAFTVKGMSNCSIPEQKREQEHQRRARLMQSMYQNNIVVWDTSHDRGNAQFGEMMTAGSILHGSKGAVVDGGIRDTDRILETGYCIWSRYRTPASMYNRHEIVTWQIPVKIGQVEVFPGDIVFADMDGIVVVPRRLACRVLIRSEELQKTERGWREILSSGVALSEYVDEGGKF